jgi:hypothetical protein
MFEGSNNNTDAAIVKPGASLGERISCASVDKPPAREYGVASHEPVAC